MFLGSLSEENRLHELDFRFQVFPDGNTFLFAHHGLNLNDLAESLELDRLGTCFYMVDLRVPLKLEEVTRDCGRFRARYEVEPTVAFGEYLEFDLPRLEQFFRNAEDDDRLDCVLVGMESEAMSIDELEAFRLALTDRERRVSLPHGRVCSWFRTHDNHFFWLIGQPVSLLRRLIAETIAGFFHHVHPHPYHPVPDSLVDLLLGDFHTAPIVCLPTEWERGREVPVGVEVHGGRVRALLETAEISWIAYQLNPPPERVGRSLLISYDCRGEVWSFEVWS